ncbi:MAG TPA: glycosyltransferase [Flavisolibacter sp.]|nr:glycosyltransferase [Flavisolibacter sp.]
MTVLLIIAGLLFLLYALLLYFYRRWFLGLKEFVPSQTTNTNIFFSVVIAARNEERNIGILLQCLVQQTYSPSQFEVLVVDDHSDDGTATKVKDWMALHRNIRCLSLADYVKGAKLNSYKKKAIEYGVQEARGEWIITTDADCVMGKDWISTYNNFIHQSNAGFVAAPVAYTYNNSALQLLQAADFLTLQGITAAGISGRFHNMCNGANLAYKRSLFFEAGGFAGIDAVASGDDLLLMQKIWRLQPDKIGYLKSTNAVVTTAPMPTWKDLFRQRIRWASKSSQYKEEKMIFSLLLVYLVNLLFLVFAVSGFFNAFWWLAALGYLLLKTAAELPFFISVCKFYKEQKLVNAFLFLQPLHIVYINTVGFLSQVGSYEWKGRRTK